MNMRVPSAVYQIVVVVVVPNSAVYQIVQCTKYSCRTKNRASPDRVFKPLRAVAYCGPLEPFRWS